MSIDFMGLLKQHASGPLLEKAAALLGENTESVQKGLLASSSSLLGGVMQKLSGDNGAELFNSLGDGSKLSKLQDRLAGGNETVNFLGQGLDKARDLLGDNTDTTISSIAASSGLKTESVSSLMGMAQPMVMGLLGSQKATGMDLDGMKNMLGGQAGALMGLLPEGLSNLTNLGGIADNLSGTVKGGLASGLGAVTGLTSAATGAVSDTANAAIGTAGAALGSAGNAASNVAASATNAIGGAGETALKVGGDIINDGKSGLGKLLPILALLAVAVGAFFFFGKGDKLTDAVNQASSSATSMVSDAAGAATDMAGSATDIAGNVAGDALNTVTDAASAVGDAAGAATDAAGDLAGSVVDTAGNAVDTVAGAVGSAGDMAGDLVNSTTDMAGKALEGGLDAATNVAGNVTDAAASMTGDALKAVASLGEKIGDKFRFTLPGGASVDVPDGSFEADMLKGLASGDASVMGKAFILDRVYFASGSSDLTAESKDQIASMAKVLSSYPELNINLRGHTDSQGSADANLALSTRRAEAVKNALVGLAVNEARVTTKGMGPVEPIADNATAVGRAKNRRIDLTLSK